MSAIGLHENIKEFIIYKKNDEEIKIIDNFFSDNVLKEIVDYFKTIDWKCQCIKDINTNLYSGDTAYWRIELMENAFFNSYLNNIIEKYFNKNMKLNRLYVVGQMYGQDSNFHIDDKEPNTYTFCFYINDIIDDDGSFFIRIPDKKTILNIEPIMNRSVIFPSNYIHKGSGFNRFSDKLRICIAWKYKILE
uniref:Fe2OG dioxygenase domain-containing protein n=1 Tax=viral metagenome TaxID=1070528 RepID=A0A6C0ETW8_9ZZZZ